MNYTFSWDVFVTFLPVLFKAALVTAEAVFISMILASVVGVVLGALLTSKSALVRVIPTAYVEVWRGVPFLVQVLWIYFGLPLFLGITLSSLVAGILSLTLWAGAYLTEIFRGGIDSISITQKYAGYALGMTPRRVFIRIILPQAFRRILPPYVSQLVVTVKMSSILSVINVDEIMKRADNIVVATFRPFEVYLAAALVYFVILLTLAQLGRYTEKKLRANVLS